tara:strand:+ start:593 stop:1156 length:564 start_codon:yes stop_codon:yes gene_type:complete
MAKKTLLNEAQVRRFMGLAGMNAMTVSNVIKEMGYHEAEEDMADAEEPPMPDAEMAGDEEPPMPDAEMAGDELPADEPAAEGEAEVNPESIEALRSAFEDVMAPLEAATAGAAEEPAELPAEEPAELPAEEPAEMPAEEPAEDEELAEVSLQLSEEEIVQEVARRVAKRIIKAKRAQKELNEALGRK